MIDVLAGPRVLELEGGEGQTDEEEDHVDRLMIGAGELDLAGAGKEVRLELGLNCRVDVVMGELVEGSKWELSTSRPFLSL